MHDVRRNLLCSKACDGPALGISNDFRVTLLPAYLLSSSTSSVTFAFLSLLCFTDEVVSKSSSLASFSNTFAPESVKRGISISLRCKRMRLGCKCYRHFIPDKNASLGWKFQHLTWKMRWKIRLKMRWKIFPVCTRSLASLVIAYLCSALGKY